MEDFQDIIHRANIENSKLLSNVSAKRNRIEAMKTKLREENLKIDEIKMSIDYSQNVIAKTEELIKEYKNQLDHLKLSINTLRDQSHLKSKLEECINYSNGIDIFYY
ncbi:unnamed protein product [Gordionus sp. m RMFG-2023]